MAHIIHLGGGKVYLGDSKEGVEVKALTMEISEPWSGVRPVFLLSDNDPSGSVLLLRFEGKGPYDD